VVSGIYIIKACPVSRQGKTKASVPSAMKMFVNTNTFIAVKKLDAIFIFKLVF
jgi:hypothetical protein